MPDPDFPKNARASIATGNLFNLFKPRVKVGGASGPIRVQADGTVEIKPEDDVERVVVLMKDRTPFDVFWAGGDRANPIRLKVKANAYDPADGTAGTRYPFDVMIVQSNGRVGSSDPDIIVGPMTRG